VAQGDARINPHGTNQHLVAAVAVTAGTNEVRVICRAAQL
jgi:hypothetical protein